MRRFAELRSEARRWGWARALYAQLMVRLRPWIVLCRISTQALAEFGRNGAASPAAHRFATQLELTELLERMPDVDKGWLPETEPDELSHCWAAFVDGKIVSFAWSAYKNAPAGDGMMVGFETPYVYGRNVYTSRPFRGQHLFDGSGAVKFHAANGHTHAIGFIETHNFASWRRARRMGDQLGGYAGYLKIGQFRIPFRTPGAKKHTFRFYQAK
ncbi:MAG: hypothetical protein CBC48_17230 [bacterium TMED88]|nr:hypothetical protein [Deltaproteobacteria bacterium]OUV24696.1 MAG: hypothetical protein CBC48_17230 [bacterium TMED88]